MRLRYTREGCEAMAKHAKIKDSRKIAEELLNQMDNIAANYPNHNPNIIHLDINRDNKEGVTCWTYRELK